MPLPIHPRLALVKGDRVLVPATVRYPTGSDEADVWLDGSLGTGRTSREGLLAVSFALDVGDEVRAAESMHLVDERVWPHGIVVAVNDGQAWVRWPVGDSLEPIAQLQRVRTALQVADCEPRPHEMTAAEDEARPAEVAP